jgi:antirestriction protein
MHDFEGWHGLTISEYPDVEEICTWAELIIEHGAAIAKFIDWAKEIDLEVSIDEFKSRYCGHFESSEKFVLLSEEVQERYQWQEFSQQHSIWANCIDWEHFANELEMMDAYQYIDAKPSKEYGIYVFRYMPE